MSQPIYKKMILIIKLNKTLKNLNLKLYHFNRKPWVRQNFLRYNFKNMIYEKS